MDLKGIADILTAPVPAVNQVAVKKAMRHSLPLGYAALSEAVAGTLSVVWMGKLENMPEPKSGQTIWLSPKDYEAVELICVSGVRL